MSDASRGVKPLIATPCYGAMLTLSYVESILRLQRQTEVQFAFQVDSLVTRARNALVTMFLEGNWSHLFFVDADIGFAPEAALRLLSADRDVVAGIYGIIHIGAAL